MNRLLEDIRRVFRSDLDLFRGRPRLVAALLGATTIPSFYAGIYLQSVWDPYSHLDALPVALVEEDAGTEVRGEHVDLGAEVVEQLDASRPFDLRPYPDADSAREAVRTGTVAFMVHFGPDFSRRAVGGLGDHRAGIDIVYSEGNSFMAGNIAQRFAAEITQRVNTTLSETRWNRVLETVESSREGLTRLQEGVGQLRSGAHELDRRLDQARHGSSRLADGANRAREGSAELADGAKKVAEGTTQLASGVRRLGAGLREMDAAIPAPDQLDELSEGSRRVADGNAALTEGLDQLHDGSARLREGAGLLAEKSAKIPIVGNRVSRGAGRIEEGAGRLTEGLSKAEAGSTALAEGSERVAEGTHRLASGVKRMGAGVHTMAEHLPDDESLERLGEGSTQIATGAHRLATGMDELTTGAGSLEQGLDQLHSGAGRLSEGLDRLASALPTDLEELPGDASGLALSVEPRLETLSHVPNYGTSMAPYFAGLSLWVGAVMVSFLFHLRQIPRRVADTSRAAKVLGRLGVPMMLVLGQATVLTLALRHVVGIEMPSTFVFWLVASVSSTVFLTIVLALITLLGDAGKAVALVFLIFQMASSGGLFPIELTGGIYARVHPYLPFTWVLMAFRATLFGAFRGGWPSFLLHVVVFGALALLAAHAVGRWKVVDDERYGPAIDL